MRSVPPLNPLLVFVAVARHGNFSGAAEVLGVTQSAVSRQIAVLESYIGRALFVRMRGGARLTPTGKAYFREVAPAFDSIISATERLLSERAAEANFLRLRVDTTFTALWLIPRFARLKSLYPKLEVQLHTGKSGDTAHGDVDLAIEFGDGNWQGQNAKLLLSDAIQPVCAPSFLKTKSVDRVAELRERCLLSSSARKSDWRDWLQSAGLSEPTASPMEFASSELAYQAAREGLGIAIGQTWLLRRDLAAGTLVPLFDPLARSLGYYVIWPKSREPRAAGRAFLKWLTAETSAEFVPVDAQADAPHSIGDGAVAAAVQEIASLVHGGRSYVGRAATSSRNPPN
jgi:LysR family glycine cleavage system transcriptional activator